MLFNRGMVDAVDRVLRWVLCYAMLGVFTILIPVALCVGRVVNAVRSILRREYR